VWGLGRPNDAVVVLAPDGRETARASLGGAVPALCPGGGAGRAIAVRSGREAVSGVGHIPHGEIVAVDEGGGVAVLREVALPGGVACKTVEGEAVVAIGSSPSVRGFAVGADVRDLTVVGAGAARDAVVFGSHVLVSVVRVEEASRLFPLPREYGEVRAYYVPEAARAPGWVYPVSAPRPAGRGALLAAEPETGRWRTLVGAVSPPAERRVLATDYCLPLAESAWVCPDGVSVRAARRGDETSVILRDEALGREFVLMGGALREVGFVAGRLEPRGEVLVTVMGPKDERQPPGQRGPVLGLFRYVPGGGAPVAEAA